MERIKVEYDEEDGLFHVSLLIDGEYIEVASHCDEDEAEQCATDINRFAQG